MSTDTPHVSDTPVEDPRLATIMDMVVSIAAYDFSRRVPVGHGDEVFDGLASGLNMLAEELAERHARDRAGRERLLQNERLLAVGQLAAGVAHEINNPASFVLTNLRVLDRDLTRLDHLLAREGSLPRDVRDLVCRAREMTRDNAVGIERIVSIVRDLRTFMRLETERVEPLDLDDVVADAATLVRAEVGYRARLMLTVPSHVRIRGDRTRLTQVFTNLLLNAAQAIPEGDRDHHRISVTGRVAGDVVIVSVQDTGQGLSTEEQTRLFEPFFTAAPREVGTGLGLALSADVVRSHGGELRLVATSPTGTTFEIELPLDRSSVAAVSEPAPEPRPAARPRVLVVDDEPLLLAAYRRIFEGQFDLHAAGSGREAIALLTADPVWDAILCDVLMPDLDGIAVFEWVTEHRPALAPRLVFCSGGAFTPRSIAFADRMADRLLQKPVSPDELVAAVERVRHL